MKVLLKGLFLFLLVGFFLTPYASQKPLSSWRKSTILVQVSGAVEKPGIYEVGNGATVGEVLAMALVKEEGDTSSLNSTMVLKSQDVIIVPAKQDQVLCVSINTGTLEQLVMVPNIGKVTAQNIIDYRNQYGLFQTVDDLVKVKGIGAKTLEKIRPYVSL